ncbi:MAG: class I SAM-dependent methyltransferase [Bryobacteraceae bacterium]
MESAELVSILRAVRDRVRARHPETAAGGVEAPLADLMPLVHARDAALGKVAAIGTVNPRRGGPLNALLQSWKRLVARALDWHVREQVEFNRHAVAAVDAAIEAINDVNRALVEFGGRLAEVKAELAAQNDSWRETERQAEDVRHHWSEWREGWEQRLAQTEIRFLRSVADYQAAAQHHSDRMDANFRESLRLQHSGFTSDLERSSVEIQKRLWNDLERMREDFERLIHDELRLIRQRASVAPLAAGAAPVGQTLAAPGPGAEAAAPSGLDYARFAERFRGSDEYVKNGQKVYLPYFAGRRAVLDIGCGRGEFLVHLRDAGIPARGIDLSRESVALCRSKGLEAETADLFQYLASLPEASLDGIFCGQVVEHLEPGRLPQMIRLAASRLEPNGLIAIETPNPECLAIFATHFYLDPTHARPVPHPLLRFYLEESGIGRIELLRLAPAVESMPSLASLPADFREQFFGALDYGLIGRKMT